MSIACPQLLRRWWDRVRSSPVGYRLARGAAWSLTGSVLTRVLTVLTSIVIARLLGKFALGQIGMIQNTAGLFSTFAGFGLGLTSTRYVAQFRHSDPARAGRILGLAALMAMGTGAVAAIGLVAAAPWLAEHTLAAPELQDELRISAVTIFFLALNGAQLGALAGFEAFGTVAGLNVIIAGVSLPIMVLGAKKGGVHGYVWSLAAAQALSWLAFHLALRRTAHRANVPWRLKGCLDELGVLHRFSLPAFLCSAMVIPAVWISNAFLVNTPHGYEENGLFSVANQWRTAILFVPATLNGTIIPVLSNLYGQRNMRTYRKVVMLNLAMTSAITGAAALGVAILSPLIVSAYGKDFHGAEVVLIMMAGSAVLMAVNDVAGADITARGKVWVGVALCILLCCAMVGLSWVLVPMYGAGGLAGATLLAYVLHTCWTQTYLRMSLRRSWPDGVTEGQPSPAIV